MASTTTGGVGAAWAMQSEIVGRAKERERERKRELRKRRRKMCVDETDRRKKECRT
jgi:hypothetical protein